MRILIVLFIITFYISACNSSDQNNSIPSTPAIQKPIPLKVDLQIVSPQEIVDHIQQSGSLMPYESTDIHSEISGRLTMLNVKEGKNVTQGEVLARLYDGDLQAQLRKLYTQLAIAKQNEKRSNELLKIQGISKQDYDLSLLNVNNIMADIDILHANISKTIIHAPFNGKLGLKNISPGAYITPAITLATIAQVNKLKLQFSVPEKYSAQIKPGFEISFTIDGTNKTYLATVIATEVTIKEDTRSLNVRALVKNTDASLVSGAYANVQMVMGREKNALMVTSSAIIPQGRNKQIFLYKNGKAIQTVVVTGVRDSTNVQIVSGLTAGDSVITSGLLYLKNNLDILPGKIN